MAMKVEEKHLPLLNIVTGAKKDSFGLAVIDSTKNTTRSPRTEEKHGDEKQRSQQAAPGTGLRAVYHNGVRVPILQDIDSKYRRDENQASCRFDIVETVRTVIQPGSYTPAMAVPKHGPGHHQQQNQAPGKTMHNNGKENKMHHHHHHHHHDHHHHNQSQHHQHEFSSHNQGLLSREQTFQSSRTGYSEKDMWDKLSSYQWRKPSPSAGKKRDARDVLYKHTYCPETLRLRYRSSTLPHIAPEPERPWTVGEDVLERHQMTNSGDSSPGRAGGTIIPRQPRGTVVRFSECMRPSTYASRGGSLEVKRVSGGKQQPQNCYQFSNVRNVFPLIRQDSRRAKRVERPLKFENSRYNTFNRTTLFKQHPTNYSPAVLTNRDYRSADTFKEYLDSLQNHNRGQHGLHSREQQQQLQHHHHQQQQQQQHPTQRLSRQSNLSSEHDYHNRALQSVQDVNKPEDNLNLKAAHTAEEDAAQPQDSRSAITIEIKASWKESVDDQSSIVEPEKDPVPNDPVPNDPVPDDPVSKDPVEPVSVVAKLPSTERPKSEGHLSCPHNTPTPVEEDPTILD